MPVTIVRKPKSKAPEELPRYVKDDDHTRLCEVGRRWMLRTLSQKGGCMQVAFTEIGCQHFSEMPDVFGFDQQGNSCMVEVKVSRSDFLADKKKPFRKDPDTGMGDNRYYMCPTGLINAEDLEGTPWGLIWVSPKGICKVVRGRASNPTYKQSWVDSWLFKKNVENENALVRTLLLRLSYNLDISGFIDGLKCQSKVDGAGMKGDPAYATIRRIERVECLDSLRHILKTEDPKCTVCAERRARDHAKLMKGLRDLEKA